MYLSYSGFKSYSSCPRQYWHQYVDKTRLETPENKVNSLYGTIVGTLFETFYSDKLWRLSGIEQKMLDLVPDHYRKAIVDAERRDAIRWKGEDVKANYATPDELLADVRTAIPRGLSIIRQHRLLGPTQSEAEVKLDQVVVGCTIGGRADFLIRRIAPHHDLVLLDGKGSKWRDKYVDVRQLKWYAMLHRMKYGFAPDRLGFVFWRFDPDVALDWVDVDLHYLDELLSNTLEVMRRIDRSKSEVGVEPPGTPRHLQLLVQHFPATPGDRCRLCAFLAVCPEGRLYGETQVPVLDDHGVEDIGFSV